MDEDPLKQQFKRAKTWAEMELGMHNIHLSIDFCSNCTTA